MTSPNHRHTLTKYCTLTTYLLLENCNFIALDKKYTDIMSPRNGYYVSSGKLSTAHFNDIVAFRFISSDFCVCRASLMQRVRTSLARDIGRRRALIDCSYDSHVRCNGLTVRVSYVNFVNGCPVLRRLDLTVHRDTFAL